MKFLPLLFILGLLTSCGNKAKGQSREKEAKQRVGKIMKQTLEEKGLTLGSPVFIRAFKDERILELFVKNGRTGKYDLFREYKIAGSSGVLGPKLAEGDGQVPEGFYFVPPSAMLPTSRYHLAFNIGFPNAFDKANGRTGSFIMIHGSNVSIGCLAMTDEKIEEIYTLCDAAHKGGQRFFRVQIFPFRMTEKRMKKFSSDPNYAFWKNLKTGYDLFEKNKLPPDVSVKNKKYVFK